MRVSQITPVNVEKRRVGVRYPTRTGVMTAGVRLLRERNIDCHVIEDDSTDPRWCEVWVEEIELNAAYVMGAIEATLGRVAFNEWWETP